MMIEFGETPAEKWLREQQRHKDLLAMSDKRQIVGPVLREPEASGSHEGALDELHRRYGGAGEPLPTLLRSASIAFSALEARAQAATALYEALRVAQIEAGEIIESLLRQLTVRHVPLEHTTARYDFMQDAVTKAIANYERVVKG